MVNVTSPYFRGFVAFAHRIFALGAVFFFLGVVWFDVGSGINVPALVWHDSIFQQMLGGFAISALFAYVWLLCFLLDTRFHREIVDLGKSRGHRLIARIMGAIIPPTEKLPTPHSPTSTDPNAPQPEKKPSEGDALRWYLGVTFLPCCLLLILPAFFSIHLNRDLDTHTADGRPVARPPFLEFKAPESTPQKPVYHIQQCWPFVAGVGITFLALRLIGTVAVLFRTRLLKNEKAKVWGSERWPHVVAAILFLWLFLLYAIMAILVNQNTYHPSPVIAVCMLIGLLAGVVGAIWFHLRLWAMPVFVLLVGWICFSDAPVYKLRFPHMGPEYAHPIKLEDFEEPAFALDDVITDPKDAVKAEKEKQEEVERVALMVASLQTQRDSSKTVAERYTQLTDKGLTGVGRYDDLLKMYTNENTAINKDEEVALNTWKKQFATPENKAVKPKLVLVTATGGANRSGLWTAHVLHKLHTDPALKDFPKHVRIISGASGGMVGAAYYVGSLDEKGGLQEGFEPRDIAQDFLTPIVNTLVFREVPLLTWPSSYYDIDRGEMLDRAMEGNVPGIRPDIKTRLNNVFAKSFQDWAPGENAGWRPSMIFSPMLVEDGRRLLISNRHVPFLTVSRGDFLLPNRPQGSLQPGTEEVSKRIDENQTKGRSSKRSKSGSEGEDVYARSGVEFFRLFPESRNRFHVSTAARMNATFPFVSPAVSLPVESPRRVVDAGYYDNTGVSIASAWIYQHRSWIAKNTSGVMVIQIRDFTSHRENRHLSLPTAQGTPFLPGLTGVLSAIDHARSASASYRNDAMLQSLSEYFSETFGGGRWYSPPSGVNSFFTTVVFERYTDVGMSWYLSEADKQDIEKSWDQGPANMNPGSVERLRQWWKSH